MENDIKMAEVDFECLDNECDGVICFNLRAALEENFQGVCPKCHKSYEFESESTYDNSKRMISPFFNSEPALIDCDFTFPIPEIRTLKPIFSNKDTASIPGIFLTSGIFVKFSLALA